MQKPKHKEPTNYEHCCSCVPVLEKEIKKLEEIIQELHMTVECYRDGR